MYTIDDFKEGRVAIYTNGESDEVEVREFLVKTIGIDGHQYSSEQYDLNSEDGIFVEEQNEGPKKWGFINEAYNTRNIPFVRKSELLDFSTAETIARIKIHIKRLRK